MENQVVEAAMNEYSVQAVKAVSAALIMAVAVWDLFLCLL